MADALEENIWTAIDSDFRMDDSAKIGPKTMRLPPIPLPAAFLEDIFPDDASITNSYSDSISLNTTQFLLSNTARTAYEADNSTASLQQNTSICSPGETFMLALPWVRITLGLLMVIENSLSLLALWHVKHMQTAIHRFISSLAVADLLMGLWICYRYSARILLSSDSVTIECRVRFLGSTYLNFTAIMSVCALCLDRCVALHLPFRYGELVTRARIRVMLAIIWTFPLLVLLMAYVGVNAPCAECSFVNIASHRTYIVLTVLRGALIALIIVCELLIFRMARCQIGKIYPDVLNARSSNRFLRMNVKASVTTFAVVIPFVVLYFPVLLTQGNLAVRPHVGDTCQSHLLSFVWLIASAHGLLTPIIFCWRFSEVRQNLLRLFSCGRSPSPLIRVFHLRTDASIS